MRTQLRLSARRVAVEWVVVGFVGVGAFKLFSSLGAMTLWTLTQSALLAANGIAVLNEHRFLAKRGLTPAAIRDGQCGATSLRGQMIGVINAVSYLRMPLVALNSVVIFVKLVFG